MPGEKFEIGESLKATRESFEKNRPLIVRLTVAFALVNGASAVLDVAGAAGLAVSFGIAILLGAAYGGMITALICIPGRTEGAGELWATVKPVLARLIWVTLITAIAVVLGLAILIIPGLVVATVLCVAGQAVVVERATVYGALGRSLTLVQDQGFRVFGFLIVIGLLSLILLALALLVAAPLGTGLAGRVTANFLSNLLSAPVLAIGTAVLYNQLARVEKARNTESTGGNLG
jgi:hypothetical protein